MNSISTELCSIFLLLFIMIDCNSKYSKKTNFNSNLFLLECVSILFLAIMNILIYIFDNNHILLLAYFISMIIPLIIHSIFINNNYISKDIKINNSLLLYFVLYTIIIAYCYLIGELNRSLNYLNEFRYLIFALNFIPILYIYIKSFINHINVEKRIYFLLLLPMVGEILNIFFKEIDFITFIYSMSLLFLYIYMHDMIINKDSLTGANNRRYLDSYVYLNDRKYAVYMIDIDDFKKTNDTYGHDKGDKVLKDLVEILKSSVRTTDSVIRTGGDEFVIIAAMKNDNDINIIYDRIKDNIKKYNNENKIKISLSIGYDLYASHLDFNIFLDNIDKKMYVNKREKKEGK